MEERRLLLFVVLSFIVFSLYLQLQAPRQPPATPAPTPTQAPQLERPAEQASAALRASDEIAPGSEAAPQVEPRAEDHERRIEVTAPHAQIAFTNRGARLVGWRLADYQDDRGRPEEMLSISPEGPRALDVETDEEAVNQRLRSALYVASESVIELAGAQERELRFEFAESDLRVVKGFRFSARRPVVEMNVSVERRGRPLNARVLWGPGIGLPSEEKRDLNSVVSLTGRSVERIETKKLGGEKRAIENARWLGVESRYFAALLVPPEGRGRRGTAHAIEVAAAATGQKTSRPIVAIQLAPEDTLEIFVGAKDYFALSRLGRDLKAVVPVGDWIGPIVVPFMALLRWVHGHVGNYGWSIVLLTVLINLAMAPFRHFGIVNGIKMARMAPELRVIQERYRKLPMMERQQKMQPEMNALYARHGMSMGGQMATGCLPLLLTMPFLIAFYRVLDVAIDLRGASFLWIPDLSLKDPYFLTPILMSLSMFLMQKMMPTAMDAAQQRMMMLMPIVLGVMFFAAPAGLNLYWLSSNVCAIGQQGVTMKLAGGSDPKKKGRR